ncbi:MAG: hypothetical protein VXV86_04860, partial [Verrucomicrobiota bacterium]|nr:hypothetical protein [Verrucomicrobiota bacterium]
MPEQDDGDGNRKQRRAALIQVAYDDVYVDDAYASFLLGDAISRGTSHLEGYHRWLKACISGSQLSPDLFRDLLAHFNYRWNIRCGVRNLGDRDYSTYSRWEVEAILNVVEGRAIEGELFP